ncbi:MAG: hypothetical protein IT375_26075 [Polyangiaceae bacterium]|nr:hypothetical protein [Polyangiaceae bacterium]
MTGSSTFEWVCAELEARTSMSKLEARGTVRLVLRDVGLDPSSVTPRQMAVVIERLLGAALSKRKVESAAELCQALMRELEQIGANRVEHHEDTAYDLFERLESDGTRRGRS